MKKTFIIILALCFTISASMNAQDLASKTGTVNKVHKGGTSIHGPASDADVIIDTVHAVKATDNRANPMFGFKGGINSSGIYNNIAGYQARPVIGWVAGAFLTLPISNLFGFQAEFLYGQKGFEYGGDYTGSDFSFKRRAVYLDMPLLFQVKPGKCVSVLAGPLLSFLIHSNDTFSNGSATSEQHAAITNGVTNKNILGAEGGIDIYIQRMVASLRAGMDIHSLNNNAAGTRPYQNYWIQATLGFNLF